MAKLTVKDREIMRKCNLTEREYLKIKAEAEENTGSTKKTNLTWLWLGLTVLIFVFIFGDNGGCKEETDQQRDEREARYAVYDAIREKALIPDDVDFGEVHIRRTEEGFSATGTFKAKNAFGTMIPHKFRSKLDENKKVIEIVVE